MLARRLMETLAMMVIGDSLLCLLSPRRHTTLWSRGPGWWERAAMVFARRPGLTRALGLAGLGFGIWMAWRQETPAREPWNGRRIGWQRLKAAMQ